MGCFSGPDIPVPPYQEPFKMPDLPSFEMPEMSFPEFPAFPAPFDPEAADVRRKRGEEVEKLKQIELRRKGYASTLLTGGQGVEADASLKRPSLLGR